VAEEEQETRRGTLVVVSRLPVPGATKSRLIPAIGAAAAAALARAFLEDVLHRFDHLPLERVLALDGPAAGSGLDVPPGFRTVEQGGGDLGERIADLYRRSEPPVVFVGGDAPTLPARFVLEARGLLLGGVEVVYQPALFTLAGFARDPEAPLAGVAWGGDDVLAQGLAAAAAAGASRGILDPWYDVDVRGDLTLLGLHLAALRGREAFARRTAEALERILEQDR